MRWDGFSPFRIHERLFMARHPPAVRGVCCRGFNHRSHQGTGLNPRFVTSRDSSEFSILISTRVSANQFRPIPRNRTYTAPPTSTTIAAIILTNSRISGPCFFPERKLTEYCTTSVSKTVQDARRGAQRSDHRHLNNLPRGDPGWRNDASEPRIIPTFPMR